MSQTAPNNLKLFYHPAERLRLTIENDRSYHTVKPAWAAPLTRPNRYLALLDGNGEEILMLDSMDELSAASREAVEREIRQRYLTATVQRVRSARQEYGATYWDVETDRGQREFVTQSMQENAIWYNDVHLLLIDVDGNRFEIPDIEAIDSDSRQILDQIL